MEDAGHQEPLVLGHQSIRGELALRAGNQHRIARMRIQRVGQVVAKHHRRVGIVGDSRRGKRGGAAGVYVAQHV